MLSMLVPSTFSFTHVNVWSCMSFLKGLLQAGAITVGLEKRFCQARPNFRPCLSEGRVTQMRMQRGQIYSRLEWDTRETFG